MTIKSKPKTRWEKLVAWDEKRRYGVEVTLSDIRKLEKLDRILRKDMDELGIKQVALSINPKEGKLTAAGIQVLRIKGKNKKRYPSSIIFDYKYIQNLNVQELRSIGWHEFGHYIFEYYYPEIARLSGRRAEQYEITETFADEFAYRKFDDVYIDATRKAVKVVYGADYDSYHVDLLKKMRKYVKQHGHGYWKEVAKEFDIPVKYDPKKARIIGVKPKKGILGNLR
jgi:hypothetical protein